MAKYEITILDQAVPVLEKALTAQNAVLASQGKPTLKTIDEFLTAEIEKEFGISADELKALEIKETIVAMTDKLAKLPIESLQTIAAAVQAEVDKKAGDSGGVGDTKP